MDGRKWFAISAAFAVAALLQGCGGGGTTPAPTSPAPPGPPAPTPAPTPTTPAPPGPTGCVHPPVFENMPPEGIAPLPNSWMYLNVPLGLNGSNAYAYVSSHDSNLVVVNWTQRREDICLGLFPGKKPPASPAIADSQPVCVLSHDGDGSNEHAVYYSEYNHKRHMPNLVAYRIPGANVSKHTHIERTWGPAKNGLDLAYGPLPENSASCCWCSNHTLQGVCNSTVDSRGHLATMSAFQPSYQDMFATCVYLNTFPSREPFDGKQWARYELENINRAKAVGEAGLFVVAGPMRQTGGTIPAEHEKGSSLDVPVWVWSAYADLDGSTVAHICAVGAPDDDCACEDHLNAQNLTRHIGFVAFPGQIQPVERN